MFKKIYIEITNCCNLNCHFCPQNHRPPQFLTINQFKTLLSQLKGHTNYLYFHILGEPLLHPQLNELLSLAQAENFQVNITTNGYLINNLKNSPKIRQLNISLHSYSPLYQKSLDNYLTDIFQITEQLLKNNTYVNYRLWVNNPYSSKILEKIQSHYHLSFTPSQTTKLKDHLYLNFNQEFTWPDLTNNLYQDQGTCYGTRDHIGILVDGTIIPCCLDSQGCIPLGNIYQENLADILSKKRFLNMKEGFQKHHKIEELCKHCGYNPKPKKEVKSQNP